MLPRRPSEEEMRDQSTLAAARCCWEEVSDWFVAEVDGFKGHLVGFGEQCLLWRPF